MAAFQPSDDNTHDLGTSSATWKDLHIKNIISTGETRFNVTDADGNPYTVVAGDHIVMHDNDVTLPAPATTNSGRELIVINTNTGAGEDITLKPAGDNQLYVGGMAITQLNGTGISSKTSIRLISTGTAWYGIAG